MSNEDKNTDDIRRLLREKLASNLPAEDGWNVPSDRVWEGVSASLKAEKKRRTWFWYAATAAALLAILLMRECSHRQEVTRMKREIQQIRQECEEKTGSRLQNNQPGSEQEPTTATEALTTAPAQQQTTISSLDSPVVYSETPAPPPGQAALFPAGSQAAGETGMKNAGAKNSPSPAQTSPAFAGELATRAHPILHFEKEKITAKSNQDAAREADETSQQAAFAYDENPAVSQLPAYQLARTENAAVDEPSVEPLVADYQLKKVIAPSLLPAFSQGNLPVKTNAPKLNLHLPLQTAERLPSAFTTSLFAAFTRTGNRLSGQKPSILQSQNALSAWRTGISLEAPLSHRLAVQLGAEYSLSRIETHYLLAVPFTHVNEFQHADGNFDNQYNHSLPSSLGNYPAQLVLSRASTAQVQEGEVMNLELFIHQQTHFLSFPLHLRLGFGERRWQAGARAGIVGNRAIDVSAGHPMLISHHSAIHERHTNVGAPSLDELQKWTLDGSLGLDLRYQLAKRLGLFFTSDYRRGLTPVYKDDLVKNTLNAWGAGAGLNFKW